MASGLKKLLESLLAEDYLYFTRLLDLGKIIIKFLCKYKYNASKDTCIHKDLRIQIKFCNY